MCIFSNLNLTTPGHLLLLVRVLVVVTLKRTRIGTNIELAGLVVTHLRLRRYLKDEDHDDLEDDKIGSKDKDSEEEVSRGDEEEGEEGEVEIGIVLGFSSIGRPWRS